MQTALRMREKEEAAIERGMAKGMEQGMERGLAKGIEQGIERGKIEMAKNLLRSGVAEEMIANASGLGIDLIRKIAKDGEED